jgi:hypothetical protein
VHGGKRGENLLSPRRITRPSTSSLRLEGRESRATAQSSMIHSKFGCEEPGNFQISSEHSTRHSRNSRRRVHRGSGRWRTGVDGGSTQCARIILVATNLEIGNRLKDGDTAVSSLFQSQEETGNEST